MALPVTITGGDVGSQNSYHGPFRSSAARFYTALKGAGASVDGELRAFKATDPTDSFAEIDSGNRPVAGDVTTDIASFNVFQVGDKLNCAVQNVDDDVFFARLDIDSGAETWDAIDGASDRDILIDGAPNGAADACDLVVRSDGDIVAVYQMEVDKVKGNPFERVGLSVSTSANRGETWSAVVSVDNQGDVERDMTGPRIVLGDSDTCHIVWKDDNTTPTMSQRALSSADALQTERTDISGAEDLETEAYPIGHGVSFDRLGMTKVRFPFSAGLDPDLGVVEFDAAADPSSFAVSANIDASNDLLFVNNSAVLCLATDGSTVHELHSRASDSDLYTTDDADSDTWNTTAAATRGTGTKNHVSCNVFDRTGPKLARIEDDAGTVKYDEDAITITIAVLGAGVDFPDQNYFTGPFEN